MQLWNRSRWVAIGMVGLVAATVGAGCAAPVDPQPEIRVEEATVEQCPHGGKVIVVGTEQHVVCGGAPGADGESTPVIVGDATGEQCPHGGYVVTVGDEVKVLCNGAPGQDGTDGTNGASAAIRSTPEAAGTQCEFGGTKLEYGIDADGNGVLDALEVVTGTTYVCNGAPGETGAPGVGVAIRVTSATATECAAGGVVVEYGYDTDGNGQLDGQETAIATSTVCNGIDGADGSNGQDGQSPTVTVTAATLADCPNGLGGFVLTVDTQTTVYCTPLVVRGDELPLGAVVYEDGATWNNAPYAWRVVDTNYGGMTGTLTLATTTSIDNRPVYNGGWANTWDTSDLRTWLNSTFFASFSPAFASHVVVSTVDWTRTTGATGQTQDNVFIASRTEMGGPVLAGEGTVFDWYADPATAQTRRAEISSTSFWTRTGEQASWSGTPYEMTLYYVTDPGDFAAGQWSSDLLGVVPVVNVDDQALFTKEADGRYRLVVSQ